MIVGYDPSLARAQRLKASVTALHGLRIGEILHLDADACHRSLQQARAFADETTRLSEAELAEIETVMARGLVSHVRTHLSALLREEGEAHDGALSLIDEFGRAPRLDSLPALLRAIEGINVAHGNPVAKLGGAMSSVQAEQPEAHERLLLLAGRWLAGSMRPNRPAGSAIVVGPYGSGRSRLVSAFNDALHSQGLAGDVPVEEIDLRALSAQPDGPARLVERLQSLARQGERRVYAFDQCELVEPALRDLLLSLAADGVATAGDKSVRVENGFLFFMLTRDPVATLGNAFVGAVQEVIELQPPVAAVLESMIAAEAQSFAHDFATRTGITLTVEAGVSAFLARKVLERGGYGHGVPDVVQQHLRLPIADLRTRGLIRTRDAQLKVLNGALTLGPAGEGVALPAVGRDARAAKPFDFEAELGALVGLEPVKDLVRSMRKLLVADRRRRDAGLELCTQQTHHILFLGNPGTGKTTVARLVARMLRELGVLREGQLVEVTRSDLVAEYVGQTATKTLAVVRRALGGVLFIDEAYALTRGDDPFGKEAIDTLVREIEQHREDLVVILAGYTQEMGEFMRANSGLASRFPHRFEFPDYTPQELARIAVCEAEHRGFRIVDGAEPRLADLFEGKVVAGRDDLGNGRLVRNVVEAAISRQSCRIADLQDAALDAMRLLSLEDFDLSEVNGPSNEDDGLQALASLDSFVGLSSIKEFVRDLAAEVRAAEHRKALGLPVDTARTLHMVFQGNPGTGKTTIARVVGRLLKELKLLKRGHVVEVDRSGLVAGYVGQTAMKVQERIREALGGLLFIDEAYALADADGGQGSFGREALDTLVKGMEDHRDSLVVILAGYTENMHRLLDTNPGLRSRFPNVVEFEDYSADELCQITKRLLASRSLAASPEAQTRISAACAAAAGDPAAGNGRFVRNLVEAAGRRQSRRLLAVKAPTVEQMSTLEADDIPGTDRDD